MEHRGAKIQVLDIPGLIAGAAMGKGRGKEVIAVVRSADLIIVLVDVFNEQHTDVLLRELHDAGIRINQQKPDITIKRPRAEVSGSTQSATSTSTSRRSVRSLRRIRSSMQTS